MPYGFYDMPEMTVSGAPGTGTITLNSNSPGYQTFANAGVHDGERITYTIRDGANFEVGRGLYAAAGTTLTRGPIYSTNGNAAISAGAGALVWITILGEDLIEPAVPQVPNVVLDFTSGYYYCAPLNPPNVLTCTRASPAYIDDLSGVWTQVAANTLRRSNKGALIEEFRINSERNNSNQGAAAGSPGVIPANWNLTGVPTGLTRTIALGSTNGVEYTEFNFAGTATSTAAPVLSLDAATGIASVNGDIWAGSTWFSNPATTALSSIALRLQILDSGGLNLGLTNLVTGLFGASWARVGATTTVANASTAFARLQIAFNTITNGTVCNFTFRIGWTGQEKVTDANASYSSPIRTTGAAASRAADVVTLTLPPSFGAAMTLAAIGVTPTMPTAFATDQYIAAISDGSTANRLSLVRLAGTAVPQWGLDAAKFAIGAAGWAQNSKSSIAVAYAANSQIGAFAGTAVECDTQSTALSGITAVTIGSDQAGASQLNGYFEKLLIWPGNRLANPAAFALTDPANGYQGSYGHAAPRPNLAQTLLVQASNEVIAPNCGVAAAGSYEIGLGYTLEIGSGGIMEVT